MIQFRPYVVGSKRFLAAAAAIRAGRERGPLGAYAEPLRRASEAARRTLGLDAYPEQIAAALGLIEGHAVEMATGEGKTLAAFLAAAALAQRGQHVTVLSSNDYLAARDAESLAGAFRESGVEVALVLPRMGEAKKRQALAAPVVYASLQQAAFDWLREGMARAPFAPRRTRRDALILDELDAALIDHASVPFSIGAAAEPSDRALLEAADAAVAGAVPERDYERQGALTTLTDLGLERAEARLRAHGQLGAEERLFEREDGALEHAIANALRAHTLLERDRHYLVDGERVCLVDALTGRVAQGRRWNHGLQQAVECRERLPLSAQPDTRVTTTAASFVRQFQRVSGTSGTLRGVAEELYELTGMRTLCLPPHRASVRVDHPDRVFPRESARRDALVARLAEEQRVGRPVLVGAWSVADALTLSRTLAGAGVQHQTLTAKDEAIEAEIIADAAAPSQITIATQLAGRGTDIRLGGRAAAHAPQESARVRELGGLLVLLHGRGPSRRHDEQLRGRAGRQGDPGETQAFVCADELSATDPGAASFDDAQARAERRTRGDRAIRDQLERSVDKQRGAFATLREAALYGLTQSESRAYAARLEASGADLRAAREPAPSLDAWWAEAVPRTLLTSLRDASQRGARAALPELVTRALREFGVAPRVAHVQGAARPLQVAAELVRLGMLRHAERARESLTLAMGQEAEAGAWLDQRFRASRPRHVLRLARVATLMAYDDAWAAFVSQLPLATDRAMMEHGPRASVTETFQRLTHEALTREIEAAHLRVAETLVSAPERVTQRVADQLAESWLARAQA